jgi:hypothetical protein
MIIICLSTLVSNQQAAQPHAQKESSLLFAATSLLPKPVVQLPMTKNKNAKGLVQQVRNLFKY